MMLPRNRMCKILDKRALMLFEAFAAPELIADDVIHL